MRGVVDIESAYLPGEMRGKGDDPDRKNYPSTGHKAGRRDQDDCTRIESRKHRRRTVAEKQCGGFDADQQIVVAVLVRVDRVIADHPQYRSGVKHDRWPVEASECGRPSHQRSPGERKTKEDLRPVRDA